MKSAQEKYENDPETTKHTLFNTETVLEVVDACFHAYASSYRIDAREMAQEICEKLSKRKEE